MPQDASGEGQAQVVPNAWLGLAEVRRAQGRFDEAIDARRRGDESPEDAGLRRAYATGHGAAGYREIETLAARLQLEALEQRSADGAYVSPLDFARTYAQLGERERAFAMLESAFADRSPGMTFPTSTGPGTPSATIHYSPPSFAAWGFRGRHELRQPW